MASNEHKLVPFPKNLKLENAPAAAADLYAAADFLISQDPECIDKENNSFASSQQALNSQGFSLRVEDFDGPIDLLLHLVKRSELPIEKLSLAKVADQFLLCIKQTIGFDLELAGEYLVIAANLLSIKAALLVDPKSDQQLELDDGPNPHDELLRRLREAEVYQEAARMIASKDFLGIDVFSPAAASHNIKKDAAEDPGLANHDAALLSKALRKILANVPAPIGITINWNRVSIGERMQFFVERLKLHPGEFVSFEDLLGDQLTLSVLVSSFVALLELCKRRVIKVSQEAYQDSIVLCLMASEGEEFISKATMVESEFDTPTQVSNIS